MTARRVHAWVWWLLPFLVARALVPVGFMAAPVDGDFKIVFCSAGSVPSHAASSEDGASVATQQAGDHTQNDFSCPFGATAAVPLLDVSGSEQIAYLPEAEVLPSAESPYYAAGPPRFIATRGPPTLI